MSENEQKGNDNGRGLKMTNEIVNETITPDMCTIESIIRLMQALPEWDTSEISGDICKDIIYRALRKILKDIGDE